MSEGAPKFESEKMTKAEYIRLAEKLSESPEGFPFPGVNPEAYAKLKADIEDDAGRSDYDILSPTLDELIERFKNEGVKVVLSRSADGTCRGTVFVMPMGSTDVQSDNLFPRHLEISSDMDPELKKLILANRK